MYARTGRHYWEAKDQGRLAFIQGLDRSINPWRKTGHVNEGEFDRGWDAEESYRL